MRHDHVLTACALASLVMASASPVRAAETPSKRPELFHYDAGGHRDPFVPLVRDGRLVNVAGSKSLELSGPALYGVLWDPGGQSIALINNMEVKVGDMVADYRVLEIRQNSVVLGNGGEPVVLQITFETTPSERSSGASTGASTGGEGQ